VRVPGAAGAGVRVPGAAGAGVRVPGAAGAGVRVPGAAGAGAPHPHDGNYVFWQALSRTQGKIGFVTVVDWPDTLYL